MSGPAYATALVPELVAGRLVLETSQGFAIRTQNWGISKERVPVGPGTACLVIRDGAVNEDSKFDDWSKLAG